MCHILCLHVERPCTSKEYIWKRLTFWYFKWDVDIEIHPSGNPDTCMQIFFTTLEIIEYFRNSSNNVVLFQLRNMAFGAKGKKKGGGNGGGQGGGSKPVPAQQWDEWKKKDDEVCITFYYGKLIL